MKFSEMKSLSIDDIDLILRDQQDLYSQEELAELTEYREYLIKQKQEQMQEQKRIEKENRRLNTVICPKCDGPNECSNVKCVYCDYTFKEDDYYAKEEPVANEEYTSHATTIPFGRLLGGFLFSGGGIWSIISGCNANNSIEAQWDSIWNNGSTDPGTTSIILGAAAVVVGIVMFMSAFLSKD